MTTTTDRATLPPTGNLAGLYVDLVVPLDTDGTILERDLTMHIQHMARTHTISGVVILGTAAENAQFDSDERRRLMEVSVEAVPEGFPCVIGVHASDTASALSELATAADVGGSHGCVFAPDADDAGSFVATVAAGSPLPLLVDLGAPQGSVLGLDALETAAACDTVEGVRTPTTDPAALAQERAVVEGRASLVGAAEGPPLLTQLEAHVDAAMVTGANVFPELWGRAVDSALTGDWDRAHATFTEKLDPLCAALNTVGSDRHVAGVKSTLTMLRVFSDPTSRDEASPANEDEVAQMTALLVDASLILG